MSSFKPLSSQVCVGPQIKPDEIAALAALNFKSIINNRPDHEEPGQPTSGDIEAAAKAYGLNYLHAPVRGMPDDPVIAAVAERLKADETNGARTLMFCRSGMRSAATWAIVQRMDGADPNQTRAAAAAAGYDLSRLPL